MANSNLIFLFLRLTNDLHLVVNRLDDFDTDTPTSWRVFLIWPNVVRGFFLFVFRGLTGPLVLLSSPVPSFFLRMYQTFCYLSDRFVLMFQPNDGLLHCGVHQMISFGLNVLESASKIPTSV